MKKGDAKLAVIIIALLLVIAAVPIALAPSLTGFSYFSLDPERQQIRGNAPSHAQSFITTYAVKAIPSKDAAVMIVSVVFLLIFGYMMYRLVKRHSLTEPEKLEEHSGSIEAESVQAEKDKLTGEITADAVLDLNKELHAKSRTDNNRTGYSPHYADELNRIQHELDRL